MVEITEREGGGVLTQLPEWYRSDPIVEACLRVIAGSSVRSREHYGAMLIDVRGEILALARNMPVFRKEPWKRQGYANHAEAMAIFVAETLGYDMRGSTIFVSGFLDDGRPFVRARGEEVCFSCVKCSKVFLEYGVSVAVPIQTGWKILSPEEAVTTAMNFSEQVERRGLVGLPFDDRVGKMLRSKIKGTTPEEAIEKLTLAGYRISQFALAALKMTKDAYLPEKPFKDGLIRTYDGRNGWGFDELEGIAD